MATIALYSAFKQTHCALVVCVSERVTVALHSAFLFCFVFYKYFRKVVRVLFGCYITGVTWKLLSRQAYFCRNKTCLVATKIFVAAPASDTKVVTVN